MHPGKWGPDLLGRGSVKVGALAGAVLRVCGVSSGDVQLCLDITLWNLLRLNLLLTGGWTRGSPEVPSNPKHSVTLWFMDCGGFTWRLLQEKNTKLSITHLQHILSVTNLLSNQFPNYCNKASFSSTKLYYLKVPTFNKKYPYDRANVHKGKFHKPSCVGRGLIWTTGKRNVHLYNFWLSLSWFVIQWLDDLEFW